LEKDVQDYEDEIDDEKFLKGSEQKQDNIEMGRKSRSKISLKMKVLHHLAQIQCLILCYS